MTHYRLRSLVEKLGYISIFNTAGILTFMATAEAQNAITPDDTLGAESSVVVPLNADTDVITGGATRGQNLFHSFEEFNIGEGNGAYFITETEAIANIFARITGNNISDIQGILGTRQFTGTGFVPTDADLFLINPNGVVFGEGAVLDVGGSFATTTATDVQFGDAGSFSTVNPEAPPTLLTIDPSAYIFNQLPIGDITSQSIRPDLIDGATEGLRVPNGETLTLLGGAIAIDGGGDFGGLTASGGRVELGAVSGTGIVELTADNTLLFPETLERADIALTNASSIEVSAGGGGSASMYANDVAILDASRITAGLVESPDTGDSQAGDIRIDATGTVAAVNEGIIANGILSSGDGGDVEITAQRLELIDGSQIATAGFGPDNVGDVTLQIAETISFSGQGPLSGDPSGIVASTFGFLAGEGDSGNITLQALAIELLDGAAIISSSLGEGNSGNITLEASDISLSGGALVASSAVLDTGNAGDISVFADRFSALEGSVLRSETSGTGDAGDIVITADGAATFEGTSANGPISGGVFSSVLPGASGEGGDVQITSESLRVVEGASLLTGTLGAGDSGNIEITTDGAVIFEGTTANEQTSSSAVSAVAAGATGAGGNITITADSLQVLNGGQLNARTAGIGDSGDIRITADGMIAFEGVSQAEQRVSGVSTAAALGSEGQGGDIAIASGALRVSDGAVIEAGTASVGDSGNILLAVDDAVLLRGIGENVGPVTGIGSPVLQGASGRGGDIEIISGSLQVVDGAVLGTSTLGTGNAGNITMAVADEALLEGIGSTGSSGALTETSGLGNAGDIEIGARSLRVADGARITANTFGAGNAGDILISVEETATFAGFGSGGQLSLARSAAVSSSGEGGDIRIAADALEILTGAQINVSTLGSGRAGDIDIDANFVRIAGTDDGQSPSGLFTIATSDGDSGDISITAADRLEVIDADINTVSFQSSGGAIAVVADQIQLSGDGDITTAVAEGTGQGGDVTLTARDFILALDDSDIFASAPEGQGGDIVLNTPGFFGENFTPASLVADPNGLDGNDRVDINATGAVSGVVTLPDMLYRK